MSTLFILGNGFDIDLGFNTSFYDYMESDEFRELKDSFNSYNSSPAYNFIQHLIHHLDRKENWFDLEKVIVEFYNNLHHSDGLVKSPDLSDKHRTEIFPTFLKSINDFILRISKDIGMENNGHKEKFWNIYSSDKKAKKLLSLMCKKTKDNEDYTVYTFNYTSEQILIPILKYIYEQLEFQKVDNKLNLHKVHGDIKEIYDKKEKIYHGIVLGGTDVSIIGGQYKFISKSDQNATKRGLFNKKTFDKFNEIIVFGHSFGLSDKHYFSQLFSSIIERENVQLHIYTKDEDSQISIKNNIREIVSNYDELNTNINIKYNDYSLFEFNP